MHLFCQNMKRVNAITVLLALHNFERFFSQEPEPLALLKLTIFIPHGAWYWF
jgi:hypothetical protein